MKRTRSALGAAIALATLAGPASAQSAADTVRAERLFREASVLVDGGDYPSACPRFEESHRLDPALGTQYNLALCYEKIGRIGSAWRNMRAVEKLARASGKKGREEVAHQMLVELRGRTPHLVLLAASPDLTIKVDAETVDPEDRTFFAVDAGEHTVLAAAPAKQPWEARVLVEAGAREVVVRVPPLADAVGPTRVVVVSPETANNRRTLGLVAGAVGLAGLGVAAATGVMLLVAKSTADQRCTPGCVDEEGRDAVTRGRTLIPINWVAWGVGLVGLGAGAFLLLTSVPNKTPRAALERLGVVTF